MVLVATPKYVEPRKLVTEAVISRLARSVTVPQEEEAKQLDQVAEMVIPDLLTGWTREVETELAAVCAAAVKRGLREWKRQQPDMTKKIIRAVADSATQAKVHRWATQVIAEVERQIDEHGLISTEWLKNVKFERPARKGEKGPRMTTGLDCVDAEFLNWFVGQLGESGINAMNRLTLRLILLGTLDWIRDERDHWRDST